MNEERHPCYNPSAALKHMRVHLPVAPSCNIQCKFCNRYYDCPNESRPGVTSALLSPNQAVAYLEKAIAQLGEINVTGIAGPGDPFSDPELTIETFQLVRKKYPQMLLCVASNGLNISKYAADLKGIGVDHVSVTINAIDPAIGAKIVSWVRYERKMFRGIEGAEILIKNQFDALDELHNRGITVKINCVVIPGINDMHVEEISKTVAAHGASYFNPMPVIPVNGSEFEGIEKPEHELMQKVRWSVSQNLQVLRHCNRCRADAAGLIGNNNSELIDSLLREVASGPLHPGEKRPYVAVASREGLLINEHLGKAGQFYIFGKGKNTFDLIEIRQAPSAGNGPQRWKDLAELLNDCSVLLVNQTGEPPKVTLSQAGIKVYTTEGLIDDALSAVLAGHQPAAVCNAKPCSGGAGGC
ncbi:MAG TPA: radical SAM protein [Chitinispirillaceae bacterium]|nr:radical SAM protein [Chitinispirillaceae bacterium]